MSAEFIILLGGLSGLVGIAFLFSRLARSLDHGISIRMQLFVAIWFTSLLATGVIGFWVINRLEDHAARLALTEGPSVNFILEILREFGPKITLIITLLALAAAGAAFALGRAVAEPIERLTHWASAVADGERHRGLPSPAGREVRRLTAAFDSMRTSLDERVHLERFTADLSHELKNPVSAIRAASEVLMEGAAEDEALRRRFLGRIDEASRRLEVLINDVLALARLEARYRDQPLGTVDLVSIIHAAVSGAESTLEAKALNIRLDLSPVAISGDDTWLRLAVTNLLLNAVRYSSEGGEINVRLTANSEFCLLDVVDDGDGVSESMVDTLFDRFATDRKTPGQTGLGLAIVRSVAELHGGTVTLMESSGGAHFRISLPLTGTAID